MKKYVLFLVLIMMISCASTQETIKKDNNIQKTSTVKKETFDDKVMKSSKKLANRISLFSKKKIAVVDFVSLQGKETEFGKYIAEIFSVNLLSNATDYQVVDRNNLKQIMEEHKLATTGMIDTNTAKEIGKIAGVDAIITGTYTPVGSKITLTIKVLDTETANIIGAEMLKVEKKNEFITMMKREIKSKNIVKKENDNTKGNIKEEKENPEKVKTLDQDNFTLEINQKKVIGNHFVVTWKNIEFSKMYVKCNFTVEYSKNIDEDSKEAGFIYQKSEIVDSKGNIAKGIDDDCGSVGNNNWTKLYSGIPVSGYVKFRRPKNKSKIIKICFVDRDRYYSKRYWTLRLDNYLDK